jgi:hypothetical protein
MKYTTERLFRQVAPRRLHALVVVSFLCLALVGRVPECSPGWITCPPQSMSLAGMGHSPPQRRLVCPHTRHGQDWRQVVERVPEVLMRSLLVWMMTGRQGRPGSPWPAAVPWLFWLWLEGGRFWPWLLLQPEWRCLGWLLWQGQRLVFLGLAAGWVRDTFLPSGELAVPPHLIAAVLGCSGDLAQVSEGTRRSG